MGNVLEFALGLQTSEFIGELGLASREVLSFAAMFEGVKMAFEKVDQTIERAAGLEELSKLTGESATNLYGLQEALKAVGGSVDAIPMMALRVGKALDGMNEAGERTDQVFSALHLSMAQLRGMSLQNQIQSIASALGHSGNSEAMASQLFGRFGAMDILRITHSMEEFNGTLHDTRREAEVFGLISSSANNYEHTMLLINSHIAGMWAGLAEGVLPTVQLIASEFEKIDFVGLGQSAGKIFYTFGEGFKQGQLATLIALAFQAGIEQGTPYFVAFTKAFTVTLTDAIVAAFEAAAKIQGSSFINNVVTAAKLAANDSAQSSAQGDMARDSAWIKKLAASGNKGEMHYWAGRLNTDTARSNQLLAEKEAIMSEFEGVKSAIINAAIEGMNGGSLGKTFMDNFKPDTSGPHPYTDAFLKKVDDLGAGFGNYMEGLKSADAKKGFENPGAGGYKPQVTDLEKIGFIFGNPGGGNDTAQRTLDVTQRIADKHEITNDLLKILTAKDFGNFVNS